jgi:transposase-like protein
MKRNRFSAEQIVNKLRQAEVLLAQGQTIAQVSKALGITEQTYYRWRKEYGGVKTD